MSNDDVAGSDRCYPLHRLVSSVFSAHPHVQLTIGSTIQHTAYVCSDSQE